MTEQLRGLSSRILASGVLPELALDALLLVGVATIGVSVYRLRPDLVWGYSGVLLLIAWWSLAKARAVASRPRG